MRNFKEAAIFLPTLNNYPEIKAHIEHIKPMLDQWDEIVVVDSFSDDGTYEYLLKELTPYGAKFFQRERGLYQCWNFGLNKIEALYTYISTIRDLPDLEKLSRMYAEMRESSADMAISPPNIVNTKYESLSDTWPIDKVISFLEITTPRFFTSEQASLINYYSNSMNGLSSVSGSLASDIVKTVYLQNPFSTEYSGAGDLLWFHENVKSMSLLIYPEKVSYFVKHPKSHRRMNQASKDKLSKIITTPHPDNKYSSAIDLIKTMNESTLRINDIQMKQREITKNFAFLRFSHPTFRKLRLEKKRLFKTLIRKESLIEQELKQVLQVTTL
ncbi:MAG: glycosyltransferase [Akkermansiaceae bacterium]